jgi:uncharacterized protein (DUF952 family)
LFYVKLTVRDSLEFSVNSLQWTEAKRKGMMTQREMPKKGFVPLSTGSFATLQDDKGKTLLY